MTHHPECEDATGEYSGSCTCALIKRREAMDDLIAQDADLLEKTSPLSNERDAGQPWLRTYDAHLKAECPRCCGNGQTYGPNSGEDIICPDCNGKGRQ